MTRPVFSPTSFWNARLPDDAPLDARSAVYVTGLQRLLTQWEPYINTTRYSTPVYTVSADQQMAHVAMDNPDPDLQAAFRQVPIPPQRETRRGDRRPHGGFPAVGRQVWEF